MESGNLDVDYQARILPRVSRTFALTIPQLPEPLRTAVGNAYLVCRIADTIEDEPTLTATESALYLQRFAATVLGTEAPEPLARELSRRLSERTLPAERELVSNMPRVISVTASLGEARVTIQRCTAIMCQGMHRFQRNASLRGLACSSDLDSYCYYVAGVVGEMLTELFSRYSPVVAAQRAPLLELSASFGEGLQLTNILKDFWEDHDRGACWLPRDVFARHGVDLARVSAQHPDPGFHAAMRELVGVAHGHLRNALTYTLLIPAREAGIRRFCLWAIGLAVLTLRNIARNPGFTCAAQIKVSHSALFATQLSTSLTVRSDKLLRQLFERAAHGLPLIAPLAARRAAIQASAQAQRSQEAEAALAGRTSPERAIAL